jgi:hypothetical protein
MTRQFGRLILVAVAALTVLGSSVARADDDGVTILVAKADYVARTLTVSVANLDAFRHLTTPKAWLAGVPLTVTVSTVNSALHTGLLTLALPNPVPTGSFLLEICWGRDRDDDDHSFEVALGTVGSVGPQGPQGPQGAAGVAGPIGPQGTPGTAGPQGTPGVAGAVGPQGAPGVAGPAGPQGAAGIGFMLRGAYDPNATYQVDDVVTEAGGSFALVTGPTTGVDPQISFAANAGIWALLASAGHDGQPGAQGAPGPQGPQGFQGQTGAQGQMGAQGPQGPVGATGAAGPPGAPGSAASLVVTPVSGSLACTPSAGTGESCSLNVVATCPAGTTAISCLAEPNTFCTDGSDTITSISQIGNTCIVDYVHVNGVCGRFALTLTTRAICLTTQ